MAAEPESSRAAEPQEQSSRGPRLGLITALALLAGVVFVIIYGYLARPGWIGVSGKQFWDYLDLLIVPAALAIGVYWLSRRQNERDQRAEDAQQERALAIAEQRTQDEALQAYLDQMSDMLIPKTDQPSLYKARPGDSLSSVARARTLTVLPRLDGDRKARVVQFLYESGLIAKSRPIVRMIKANLRGAVLIRTNLSGANLSHAHLSRADLSRADLSRADLSSAYLSSAYLNKTDLSGAVLSGAVLSYAVLREAVLIRTNLSSADLSEAFLFGADLSEADLSGADLSGADLSGTRGCTEEQLRAAGSLEGATMPDQQKYEDWIKDK